MGNNLLEVRDLKTRFRTPEGTVYAVNGVSFDVPQGSTLAVVGESGCGKSVTMLSIMRLIPIPPGEIVSGSANYQGRDLFKLSEAQMETDIRGQSIAMVFQDPMTSLNPVLTIGRQITEALRVHKGLSNEAARQRAIELLNLVGIPGGENRLQSYPHQFSGGMRQRVMIAMALSCDPVLLIADEPTTALDVTIQAQIIELVQSLRESINLSIIWITHDLGVVAGMADRVIVMYAGYIVEEADVDTLYEDPRHPYTLALLEALPRADRRRDKMLKTIPGAPPNLLVEPKGCPFAPRCEYVRDLCQTTNPTLSQVPSSSYVTAPGGTPPSHRIACWVDIQTGALR